MVDQLKNTGIGLLASNLYEIQIKESIEPGFAAWFEGMKIGHSKNGGTVISGPFVDKSALHGLLATIGELNLTLISIKKIEASNPGTGGNHEK